MASIPGLRPSTGKAGGGPSRGWYIVGAGLIACATALVVTGFMQMRDTVGSMQRVVMPARTEVTLAAGRSTLYVEQRSVVNDRPYVVDGDLQLECTLQSSSGTALALQQPRARVTYNAGDFAGRNAFDLDVPAPGTYTLDCKAPRQFVLAIGGGIGAWLVVALVGALVPGLAGLVMLVVVFIKRRRIRGPVAT